MMENILFEDINNNDRIKEGLSESIRLDKIHHGYIFEGSLNTNKFDFAKAFAKAILCKENIAKGCRNCPTCIKIEKGEHIDITIVEATMSKGSKVRSIKNQDILNLLERLSKKPFEGERNIAIIKDADTMSPSAFNSFLKTLEEPPIGTVIIILSENSSILPETIRSRCARYFIAPFNKEEKESNSEIWQISNLLIDKAPYYKIKPLVEKRIKEKEDSIYFLDSLETIFRDLLIEEDKRIDRDYVFQVVKEIEIARYEIQMDVSRSYAVKKMILKIGG